MLFRSQKTIKQLDVVKNYASTAPVNAIVCGGDWLSNGDLGVDAVAKLSVSDRIVRSIGLPYVSAVGNHDTNYLGNGTLGELALRNAIARGEDAPYYSVKVNNTTFYVFNSGTDNDAVMTENFEKQVSWFESRLIEDKPEHAVIVIHIIYRTGNDIDTNTVAPLCDALANTAEMFNRKEGVFGGVPGSVHLIIGGHNHRDLNGYVRSIPYMMSRQMTNYGNGVASFDLVALDYTYNECVTVRVGDGESRTIELAVGEVVESKTITFTQSIEEYSYGDLTDSSQPLTVLADGVQYNSFPAVIPFTNEVTFICNDSGNGISMGFSNGDTLNLEADGEETIYLNESVEVTYLYKN